MAERDALLSLAVRCEAMEAPDRTLDVAVLEGLGAGIDHNVGVLHWPGNGAGDWQIIPDLSRRNLSAVRDLQARVLPSHRIEVVQYDGGWDVTLRNDVGRAVATSIDAKTEEGGRLAAVLRAKAKEGAA